jgi:molybdate transport system regulatory protein
MMTHQGPHPNAPQLFLQLQLSREQETVLNDKAIALLRAIRQKGSLYRAARALGLSYMRAWTWVQLGNRHFASPLVELTRGGAQGGGARLTPTGQRVLRLCTTMKREAEQRIAASWVELKTLLRPSSAESELSVALSSRRYIASGMSQSIRNRLAGRVVSVVSDKVMSEVVLETYLGHIVAVVTTRSVQEMQLKPGDQAYALVKATNV